jgi:hypothetical protein
MNEPRTNTFFPSIFWLWLPLIFLFVQMAMEFTLSEQILSSMQSEGGPHELVEFLFLLAGLVIALMTLARMSIKKNIWLALWVLIAALCCLYVGGEEISWGQQLLHWSTPEQWAAINDQNETNLHNTSSWLDQKPRLILLIGVVIGGIIIPWLRKLKSGLVPEKFAIIYPPITFGVVDMITLLVQIIDKINIGAFERGSEVVELYLFYFVLMYLVVLRGRILQNQG